MDDRNKKSRGTKRKRENEGEGEEGAQPEKDVTIKFRTKLHHEVKEVKKTSKKVKAFETQKLVKKLKDARKKDDTQSVQSIEAQIAYLKQLDTDRMAILALRNKIKKDKQLSNESACQNAVPLELDLPNDPPNTTKDGDSILVESRFLSSKQLAKETDEVLQRLRKLVFGVPDDNGGDADAGGNDDQGAGWTGFGEEAGVGAKKKLSKALPHQDSDSSNEEDSEEEGGKQHLSNSEDGDGGADGWESGSLPDDDGDHTIAAVGSDDIDSDADHESSSGSSEGVAIPVQSTSKVKADSKAKVKTKPKTNPATTEKATDGSTFLPSLSVGYIRGDSDSDWSDGDADAATLPERKNRRGQRARKAIWEKKYGRNANHIKKQQEAQEQENAAKAYARAGRGSMGRGRGGRGGGDLGTRGSRGFNQPSVNPTFNASERGPPAKRPAVDRPIHPSWEAKMKMKQSITIASPQGKRMTF